MSYDTEILKNAKPGMTQETSDNPVKGSGLYRHPESGTEAIVMSDPLFGSAQAEGFVRLGFEFIREALPGEIKSIVEVQKESVNPVTQAQEDKVRLDALELDSLRREKRERESAEAEANQKVADAAVATEEVKLNDEANQKVADAKKESK